MADFDPKYAHLAEHVKGIRLVDQPQDLALHGADEAEKKELDAWLSQFDKELLPLIQSNDKKLLPTLHKYNKALLTTTFQVSNHVTLADFVFYVHIHPLLAQWAEKDRLIFVNITRWFDHIQHIVSRDGAPAKVDINLDIPYESKKKKEEEQKQKQQQKKEKEAAGGDKKKDSGAVPSPATIPETSDKKEETQENIQKKEEHSIPTKAEETKEEGKGKGKGKEKQQQQPQQKGQPQEKGGKKGGGGGGAAKEKEVPPKLSDTEDISRLDIRVGLIKSCRRHENADSLYIEEIDVGEEAPRQVVSGLVKFVPLDQMQNRPVLLLCNLKPANLKGVRSQAMVLAASNEDHTQVELVDPPAAARVGERVTFAGFEGFEPEKALKKETLDIVLPELKSNADRVATYKGVPFTTSAGVCTVKTIANSGIR
jgi:methionine--tRNA ligase beta chain